jgi:cell division protein FtsB
MAAEAKRVEELLRVNAELAAEIRNLAEGRADGPRSATMTTSRRLGIILDERDTAAEQRDETAAQLEETRERLAAVEAHRDQIERRNAELAAEVLRLRGGWRGLGRRLRAKLLAR